MRVCIVDTGSCDSVLLIPEGIYEESTRRFYEGSITGRRCEAEITGRRLAEVIMS